jgi:hypothetical protein
LFSPKANARSRAPARLQTCNSIIEDDLQA